MFGSAREEEEEEEDVQGGGGIVNGVRAEGENHTVKEVKQCHVRPVCVTLFASKHTA